jgi:hypothetical protein
MRLDDDKPSWASTIASYRASVRRARAQAVRELPVRLLAASFVIGTAITALLARAL